MPSQHEHLFFIFGMFPYFFFCKTSVSFPNADSVTRFPDLSLLNFENSCPIFLVSPCIPFFLTTFPISSHGFLVSASPYDLISFPLYFAIALFCLSVFYYISSPSPSVSCYCCHHSYSRKYVKLLSQIFCPVCAGHPTIICAILSFVLYHVGLCSLYP